MQNKILIAITFLSIGLLIGLHQEHIQKDKTISILQGSKVEVSKPKLPLIEDLK